MRCLLIGEDGSQRRRLQRLFRESGWHLTAMRSAMEAPAAIPRNVDLTILAGTTPWQSLDIEIDTVRNACHAAIIVVLSDFSVDARMRALALGATDFIQQNISGDLLLARVSALLRLRGNLTQGIFEAGNLQVDLQHRRARQSGNELKLSQMEFDLLALLVQHHGQAVTRSELIERLWEEGAQVEDNALEVHVSRLRRKLLSNPACRIATIRGIGYRLEVLAACPRPAPA